MKDREPLVAFEQEAAASGSCAKPPRPAELPALVTESLRVALAQQRDVVRTTYLEITELRQRLLAAEQRLERLRASLSYRLGQAIVSTRGWRAGLTLPGRLWRAYRDFQVNRKSKRQMISPPVSVARRAAAMQHALAIARLRGPIQAAQWARSHVRDGVDQARILVEIALLALPGDCDAATELAARAARLTPDSPWLKGLRLSIAAAATEPRPDRNRAQPGAPA